LRRRNSGISEEQKEDLSVILAASLTLLALIIGFSFSMATNRYDHARVSKKVKPTRSGPNSCAPIFYAGRCRKRAEAS